MKRSLKKAQLHKGKTSKILQATLKEKRREIIKEWIDSGMIEVLHHKQG